MKQKKVILISIDGMRPDGLLTCGNPYVDTMRAEATYSLDVQTVFPPVTLPCHISMFHSVPPERHGITTNTYVPQMRPVEGLGKRLKHAGKVNAMFYGWGPLRDISRPSDFHYAEFAGIHMLERCDDYLTDRAIACVRERHPDFVFLYLGTTDEVGHDSGWMCPPYLEALAIAIDDVKRVREACGDEYSIIVTADHGGHDRMHGADIPEDMTIPMFCFGDAFERGKQFRGGSILDVAPTIVDLFGIEPNEDWEGKSLLK